MTGGIGTWRYMAPEVVRDEPYDEKIDIYGLGLIMYYLFSGRPPFFSVGKDPRPVLRAYRRGHEPRPSLRGLSKALRGFLPRGEIGPNRWRTGHFLIIFVHVLTCFCYFCVFHHFWMVLGWP